MIIAAVRAVDDNVTAAVLLDDHVDETVTATGLGCSAAPYETVIATAIGQSDPQGSQVLLCIVGVSS